MGKWNFEPINNLSIIDEESTLNQVMVAIDRVKGGGWSTRWTICPMDYEVNILFKTLFSKGGSEMDDVLINKIYKLCCAKEVVSIKDSKGITLDAIRELDIKLEHVNDGDEFTIGNHWLENEEGSIWEEICYGDGMHNMLMVTDFGTIISRTAKGYKAKKEYKNGV